MTYFRRSWSLLILFLMGTVNLLDRSIINVLAQDIKVEFGLSDAKLGLLTGTAFGLFYALLGIPLGRLADRVNRVSLIAVVMAVWSIFTILCGFTGTFGTLFLCRMGVGAGEAGSQPAATALVPDLFPPALRASAMSFLLLNASFGSFLGLLLGGYVASISGWRSAFFIAGIPGLLLALVMYFSVSDPRQLPRAHTPSFDGSLSAAIRDLFRRPRFSGVLVAMIMSMFLVYASGAWLPAFFIRAHALTTAQAGAYTALCVGLGGGIGTLGAGLLCDLLRSRVAQVETKMLVVVLALSVPSILVAVLSHDSGIALVAMFLFDIFAFAWLAPTLRLVQIAAGGAHHALAVAIGSCSGTIISLSAGLPLIGILSDVLARAKIANSLGMALAMTIPTAALIAIVANWRSLAPDKQFVGQGCSEEQ